MNTATDHQVAIFPLNTVLFPGGRLPLRIFEQRYIEMTKQCIANNLPFQSEYPGNRRWNLTFKTGQVLALPEGDEKAAGALLSFARMDGVNRLLGGKVAAFDMRAPDRIYMRVPGHADEVAAEKRAADQAKAEATFTKLDINKDGKLSADEQPKGKKNKPKKEESSDESDSES